MTRRLRLSWPDRRPFEGREDRPIRLLAASDEPDPALEHAANRARLGTLDAVLGCGDLEPDWLAFLGDAFAAPLAFVRGNHDRGLGWRAGGAAIPDPLPGGRIARVAGLDVAALPWPGAGILGDQRDETGAWQQVGSIVARRAGRRIRGVAPPLLVLSHAPPEGAGDAPDSYHRGFRAYRWLLDRFRPPLWLHGHVTTASVPELAVVVGGTTLVNVTGSVLVELDPPA